MVDEAQRRCGLVALVGAPNAGKSTLLNQLVGAKVSIVTPKVQTTRTRVTGIAIEGTTQLVFVDTPGIFTRTKRRLERAMVASAWAGAADADQVVVVVDGTKKGIGDDARRILAGLKEGKRKAILALNKVDLIKRQELLPRAAQLNEAFDFEKTFMISAQTGDGVGDLRKHLAGLMPEGPWLFAEDDLSDLPERLLAAEVTREQLFLKLHDELPYDLMVETENWKDFKDGSVKIQQVIYVRRDSQKSIVLGKGGATVKAINLAARKELEAQLGRRVHLFLFVKVRDTWPDDPERFKAMGLDWVE
ncbi:MAG: GTPase Era [Alphaproteobacteria bacterium]|nr:GTPase Era [Alphaproteobacteria bacterium]